MKTPFLLSALSLFALLLLPSCVDPNYYGNPVSSSYYGSSSYTTLPYGYRTVHVSGTPYYYYGNSWYRRSGGRYITCSRPHGYHGSIGHVTRYGHGISRLPYGYRTITIGNSLYYNHGSTWYRRSGSRYVTCARPVGYRGGYRSYPNYYNYRNYNHKYKHKYNDNRRKSHSNYRSHRGYRSSDYYRSKKNYKRDKHYNSNNRHRIKHDHKLHRKTHIKRPEPPRPSKPPKKSKKLHPLSKPVNYS